MADGRHVTDTITNWGFEGQHCFYCTSSNISLTWDWTFIRGGNQGGVGDKNEGKALIFLMLNIQIMDAVLNGLQTEGIILSFQKLNPATALQPRLNS